MFCGRSQLVRLLASQRESTVKRRLKIDSTREFDTQSRLMSTTMVNAKHKLEELCPYLEEALNMSDTSTTYSGDTGDLDSDDDLDSDEYDSDDSDDISYEETVCSEFKWASSYSKGSVLATSNSRRKLNLAGDSGDLDLLEQFHAVDRLLKTRGARTLGRKGIVSVVQKSLPTQTASSLVMEDKPKDFLLKLIESIGSSIRVSDFKAFGDVFVHGDAKAYTSAVMGSVRRNDLAALRQLHAAGNNLQCCNSFGETIVHLVARRGLPDFLDFLIDEAGVSVLVCCDTGRTPMHDACWTASPNFACVRTLVEQCPDFLLIKDKRGFTPLDYVPREIWPSWNEFLLMNQSLLL